MSQPDFKIQVSFDNPNIISTVPEKQEIRDAVPGNSFTEVTEEHMKENTSNIVQDVSYDENYTKLSDHTEQKAEDETHEKEDLVTAISKEDFVLSPVITVTKEEAVFTKGDLKLQRVSVTEDISDTKSTTTVEQENVINNGVPQIWSEVVNLQQVRTERQTEEGEQTESKKPKTRIPTLKFRQAVDKLKQDRKNFEDKKEPETSQPTLRRSSIPRIIDGGTAALKINNSNPTEAEKTDTIPRLSDEFDKLYDEIAESPESLDNFSIGSRIEDPVKLDSKFEEIIHAYAENKIQPINVEKGRQSKIPLLKRKSEHELEVPKETAPVIKQSISVDLSKIKNFGYLKEDHGKIQSVTLNKSPIRTSLISKRISETNSLRESSTVVCNNESNFMKKEVFNKTQEVNNNEGIMTAMEKVETVTLDIPFLEPIIDNNESLISNIKEHTQEAINYESVENTEDENTCTGNEEKQINSVKTANNQNDIDIKKSKHIEKNLSTEVLPENKNEEDIDILRGRVNRIIKRMDSKETEVKQSKKDLADETPKKKSVLSKIALFERPKSADLKANIRYITQKSEPENVNKTNESSDTPKIVEGVLKALPVRVIEEKIDKDIDTLKINDNSNDVAATQLELKDKKETFDIEIVNIEPLKDNDVPATQYDSKNEKNTFDNKIVEMEPHLTIQSIKPLIGVDSEQYIKNRRIETQFNPIGDEHRLNILIADMRSQEPTQSTKMVETEINNANYKTQNNFAHIPFDSEHNNFEETNHSSTNFPNNDYRLIQVEGDLSTPAEVHSNQTCNTDINNESHSLQTNSLGILSTRLDTQKIDSRSALNETARYLKGGWNSFDEKQSNTTSYNKLNETTVTNNKPEIISDIIKQEVKFERAKVNDRTTIERAKANDTIHFDKIEENGIFHSKIRKDEGQLRIHAYRNNELNNKIKSKSLAELDLGDAVKGRVKNLIVRMKSLDRLDAEKKEIIDIKERPRKRSVLEKIALFERKLTPIRLEKTDSRKIETKSVPEKSSLSEEEYSQKIEELSLAKAKNGVLDPGKMKYLELPDGGKMPAIGIGTALLDPKLTRHIVQAAIDLGYRTIDTAYIYGNEKEVGEGIREKIKDGTVTRSELFIICKLWNNFHRQDLVKRACRASLDAMGLDYFDLYLIHSPMSFKEGSDPIPKIANVIQFSEHDYLDAWFGVEDLVKEGLVRWAGVSNFNSQQIDRVVEKGKIKPVINQVECHPYLSQHRLDSFCQERNVKLCCYGVLGSKGTPLEYKSAQQPAIDDPLVRVMAAGLNVSPASLLISYQLALGRGVVVKASSADRLWENLQALSFTPGLTDVSALNALNKNKRTYTFKGMGDTHRNYPFNIPY